MNRYKFLNIASIIISGGAVIIISSFCYIRFYPFDVLKNWRLTVPAATYHPGQEVNLHVQADKVRAVRAYAHRNIECKANGKFVSYHLMDIQGSTKTGHISSNITFKIPYIIPDLPTTCRFSIEADYIIYSFREVNEYTYSNEFTLQ